MIYGNLCYLTSGQASEQTIIEGSTIKTESDLQSTSEQRQKCLDFQRESCRLLKKGDLLSDTSSETTLFLISVCTFTEQIPNCNGEDCTTRNAAMNSYYDEMGITYSTKDMY